MRGACQKVRKAVGAIGDRSDVSASAQRYALLGDPNRLALSLSINHAGPISVTDLAVAVDMNDTTVSQALRLLRVSGAVVARREGRVIRYELADKTVRQLLRHVGAAPTPRM